MGLLKRMSGIVSANLNDLIDQCEDPEKMLRQTVRDMETALGQLMDGGARAIANHKLLSRQLQDERNAVARRLQLAEAAVLRSDDETARRELLRKAEHHRLAEALARDVEAADVLSQKLRRQVTAMRITMAEVRRKLADITARNRAAAAQRKFVAHLPNAVCASRVCSNFDAMYARIEQTEAETEALLELCGETDVNQVLDAEIDAELRALKEAACHATY
jgi:phage shock protein A